MHTHMPVYPIKSLIDSTPNPLRRTEHLRSERLLTEFVNTFSSVDTHCICVHTAASHDDILPVVRACVYPTANRVFMRRIIDHHVVLRDV